MGGKRAPIFAGVAVVAVVLIVTFFLVLPKIGQVKDANAALTEAQAQQATLGAQLAALQQAEAEAPINRETIRRVQQAIPPTVDQQGFILLVQNAAVAVFDRRRDDHTEQSRSSIRPRASRP